MFAVNSSAFSIRSVSPVTTSSGDVAIRDLMAKSNPCPPTDRSPHDGMNNCQLNEFERDDKFRMQLGSLSRSSRSKIVPGMTRKEREYQGSERNILNTSMAMEASETYNLVDVWECRSANNVQSKQLQFNSTSDTFVDKHGVQRDLKALLIRSALDASVSHDSVIRNSSAE